ncbi:glutamate decarboxylase [Dickeya dianthicola]|uniref:Glutamate decarboxylase n=1 Tax=Dickeya dianthicola TaxID=204039 RepID=A0AAX1C9G9_9GAMM|nr:glutamate decarboxylase [Dickeya dianthicola]
MCSGYWGINLNRLTTRTMNVNADHVGTSKTSIIHQIQIIRGIPSPLSEINIRLQYITPLKLT